MENSVTKTIVFLIPRYFHSTENFGTYQNFRLTPRFSSSCDGIPPRFLLPRRLPRHLGTRSSAGAPTSPRTSRDISLLHGAAPVTLASQSRRPPPHTGPGPAPRRAAGGLSHDRGQPNAPPATAPRAGGLSLVHGGGLAPACSRLFSRRPASSASPRRPALSPASPNRPRRPLARSRAHLPRQPPALAASPSSAAAA